MVPSALAKDFQLGDRAASPYDPSRPQPTRADAQMSDFRPLSENELSALSTEGLIAYHHEARRLGRHAEARTALGILVWSFEDRVRYLGLAHGPTPGRRGRRRHRLRERPQVLLRGHAASPVRRLASGDLPPARDRLPPPRRAAARRGAPARGARARGGDLGQPPARSPTRPRS